MRFMILVKATGDSEAGVMPTEEDMAPMAEYHEELARAGVLLDASGLRPSSDGRSPEVDRFRDLDLPSQGEEAGR